MSENPTVTPGIAEQKSLGMYRWFILAMLLFIALARGLVWYSPGPLLATIMDDLSINYSEAGVLLSVISLMFAFFVYLGSYLVDRFGVKWAMLIGLTIIMAGSGVVWASWNYPSLLAGRIIIGLGIGTTAPLFAATYSVWFRAGERPIVNALHNAVMSISTAAIYMTLVFMHGHIGSWHATMGLTGLFVLVAGAIYAVFGKDVVRRCGADTAAVGGRKQSGIVMALRHRPIVILAIATTGVMLTFTIFHTYMPLYFQEVRGMSQAEAGILTGMRPLIGVAGTLGAGFLTGYTGRRKGILVFAYVAVLLGAVGVMYVPGGLLLYFFIGLLGFGNSAYAPVFMTIPMDLKNSSPQLVAGAIALGSGIGMVMSFVATLVFNPLVNLFGLGSAMFLFVLPIILAII